MCINDFCHKPHRNNLFIYESDYKANKDSLHKDAWLYDAEKFIVADKNKYFFNRKIWWANLGYHYDWDHRCYFKNTDSNIPDILLDIAN